MGAFNENLKRIRKQKGITQEAVANAVGVSTQAVSKWETSSYPDGALLPQIADFLGVTIDELYGRADESVSIETRVLRYLKSIDQEKRIPAMFEICRCLFLTLSADSVYQPASNASKEEESMSVSQLSFDNGWAQARTKNKQSYFVLLPEPEKGYDDYLKYDERFVSLFKFLSLPNALRAMYFLTENTSSKFFTVESLMKELKITKQNALEILNGMLEFDFIWKASLDNGENKEYIYQYTLYGNFVQFMTFAKELITHHTGFIYQSNCRSGDAPWFKNSTYKNRT